MWLLSLIAVVQVAAQQPAPQLPPGVRVERDIVYAKTPQQELLLDVYLPENSRPPFPVVVWIHGGAWRAGSKANPAAIRLAPRGYAVVSINYRLTKVAPFPAQIQDCKAVIRWVRAHATRYNFDAGVDQGKRLGDERRGAGSDLRLHRVLVEPSAASFFVGLPEPGGI